MHNGEVKRGITAAIVIGVEAAQDGLRPPARRAAADAAEFVNALGLPADRRILLVDGSATKTTIESRLRKLSVGPNDVLAFFFGGYSFATDGHNYLVAHDSQPDDLMDTAIALRSVVESIGRTPARAVFFLDMRPLPAGLAHADDFADEELEALFGESETRLAFVSRAAGEDSCVSDALKHGIWSHLLIEAFRGNAAAALDARQRITPRSLQRYLAVAMPRALRQVLEQPVEQTPTSHGRPQTGFSLADLGPVLRARHESAGLGGRQLERIVLWSETRTRVKDLARFEKTHRIPDRVRPATVRFVAALARDDLQADLDAVYSTVREHLGYRRKDVTLTQPTDGAGALRTPDFDYLVSVALAADEPSEVVIRREVTNLRSPEILRRPAFQAAFGSSFRALSFESGADVGVAEFIDRLEDDPPKRVRLQSAADASWCELELAGFPGTIRVERRRLDILGRQMGDANTLWAAFEAFRQVFNRTAAAAALPPAER
jgi:hypothetical protein